ncbi:MAG TPA: carbamate kinase [Streptosporangiaceae bacterium]|nr:carbamate kinase [Streptosporangiaceae bacterium]
MRIVIALGGQALLWRSAPMTAEVQGQNARIAARAIAPLAAEHSIVVVHGNGPHVSPLALQAGSHPGAEPYPLDVLDAGHQGMIGYLIQRELRNLLPPLTPVATVLTMITVDPDDPAFARPSTFVGPVYHQDASDTLAAKRGWTFRRDGTAWRRVVASPEPRQVVEIQPITWLLQHGAVVVCAGGRGMPSVHPTLSPGVLAGQESVIDKDLAGEMLAEAVGADLFLMATDIDGVYLRWGTAEQRRLGHVTPGELAGYQFASGSMGPKVEAAVRFATKTGNRAAIGALADIPGIVAGRAGTNVIMRSGLRTTVPAASGSGATAGTAVTAGTEAGEATPRRTWNPARRGPGPAAGAG